MLLSCISIARDGNWSASNGIVYGVYVGFILIHAVCAIYSGSIMPRIQTFTIFVNVGLLIATVIALPVGKVTRGESLNPGSYVFGHVDNLTTWPTGWSFVLAFLAPIWSIGFFDSCVHMSEEALHAARAVPLGIIWSSGCATVLGFLVLAVIAAVMNQDVNATLGTVYGQPMAQVFSSCVYVKEGEVLNGTNRSTTTRSARKVLSASWAFSSSFNSSWASVW